MSGRGGHSLRSLGFRAFLGTQFLGAFNDNLFKLLICFLAGRLVGESGGDRVYVPLAGAMLTLPFLTFSSWAGQVADRFSKKRVMVWAKVAEVVIMTAGFLVFVHGALPLLLFLLFLMGAQSAFFSPAKYGFLPETLAPEDLSRGNGKVQMWTFVSIILGMVAATTLADILPPAGPLLPADAHELHWAASVCIVVAALGTLASFWITPTPPGKMPDPEAGRGLPTIWRTLREMAGQKVLRRSLAGTAYFWFLAALFQLNVLLYAQREMGASERLVGVLLAVTALGIGLGSELAGRISGDHVEFRLVPLGAAGMAIFSCLLVFVPRHPLLAMVFLGGLGVSAGFFSLPVTTAIQRRSPPERLGRYLGTTNFVNFSAMTVAALFLAVVLLPACVRPSHVFGLAGLSAAGVLGVMFGRHPSFLSRLAMWIVPAPFYRLRVRGAENIPEEGGALLVCNHISFADAPLLQTAVRGRPIRFLIHKSYYEKPFFRFFARRLRCVPIAAEDSPRELISSLRAATEAIRGGDLVCVFPEAMISRLGVLLPFRRGIDAIMRRLDAPIVPMALGGLWGDQLSFRWGSPLRHGIRRWLNRPLRCPVAVHIGPPLAGDTPAALVRERVAELLLAAEEPSRETVSPALLLLRRAKGLSEEHRFLPGECRGGLLRRAGDALACAGRLRHVLREQREIVVSPHLATDEVVRSSDVAAILGKNLRFGDDEDVPASGCAALPPGVSGAARLAATLACLLLPAAWIARYLGSGNEHDGGSSSSTLRAARRFVDAFRLGPGDVLSFVGSAPPAFAPWCALYSGCSLASDPGRSTVPVGTAEALAECARGTWRFAVCTGPLAEDRRCLLEDCLGCPVLRLTLASDGLMPVLAELPGASDGPVRQEGRRPGTVGLPVPGTFVRTVDADGSILPPGRTGMLHSLYRDGGTTRSTRLGCGAIDEDGFVMLAD